MNLNAALVVRILPDETEVGALLIMRLWIGYRGRNLVSVFWLFAKTATSRIAENELRAVEYIRSFLT